MARGPEAHQVVVIRAVGVFTLAAGINADALVEVTEIDNHPPGRAPANCANVAAGIHREIRADGWAGVATQFRLAGQ